MTKDRTESTLELDLPTEEALTRWAESAETWGASWQREGRGGRLDLPVSVGLRQGWLRVRVRAEELSSNQTRLVVDVQEESLVVHRAAAAVLGLSAAGALVVCLWPFFPGLLPLAPLAAVLAIAGWMMVGSRVRHHGLGDFLDLVAEDSENPAD